MNTQVKRHSLWKAGLLCLGVTAGMQAQASVTISGTRVVYNAADKETTVKVNNKGQVPALVQVWIDKGDSEAAPTSIDVPFTVTPPVTRIEVDKSQTLRIFYTGEALPKDKESLFWLNVLDVPPKESSQGGANNYLQFAIRTRIKLFFRPAQLKGNAQTAPAELIWRATGRGASAALDVRNPTPYYVSFASVQWGQATLDEGGMVAPGETAHFTLKGTASGEAKVHYRAINDFGGITEGDASLSADAPH